MPPRDPLQRVRDILDATRAIRAFVEGMDEASFRSDRRTLDAVLRNLTVIGEAARNVPEEFRARFPEVPWLEMSDMRNVVVHEYFGVDVGILWQTATKDVAVLEAALGAVVTALGGEPGSRDESGRGGR
ncbi:MAG: DUF86 domain-containing protein [Thermoanaerobaculia bacterium]